MRIERNKLDEAIQGLRERRARNPKDYLVNWILAEAILQQGPIKKRNKFFASRVGQRAQARASATGEDDSKHGGSIRESGSTASSESFQPRMIRLGSCEYAPQPFASRVIEGGRSGVEVLFVSIDARAVGFV